MIHQRRTAPGDLHTKRHPLELQGQFVDNVSGTIALTNRIAMPNLQTVRHSSTPVPS